jgi:hypothetical protein
MSRRESAIEGAASVIERILALVPVEYRAPALAMAAKQLEAPPGPVSVRASEVPMRNVRGEDLMTKVVYLFARSITKHHSPRDAALMLFREHGNLPGSGRLLDYLEDRHRLRYGYWPACWRTWPRPPRLSLSTA